MKSKKIFRWLLRTFIFFFILMNVIAIFQAYRFTHFTDSDVAKTPNPETITTAEILKTLVFGVANPRPVNTKLPTGQFETVVLQSNKKIECWHIQTKEAKGTIILFHGYGGEKSSMLDKSDEFITQGYNTFLVDFMGSGGSEGNQTTIGYKEAEEVKTAFDYISKNGEKNIYLFGTSLGAAAILKALHDYPITPQAIIIECPFGSLYQTTCARFRILHIPTVPMAGLLDFWGGIENGFLAFSHQPAQYATSVQCPALLLWGEKDDRVSRKETDEIFANLSGEKELKTFPLAGHEDYLNQYKNLWVADVQEFLNRTAGKRKK